MIYLNTLGMICPLGHTRQAISEALYRHPESKIAETARYTGTLLPLGCCEDVTLPALDGPAATRNNRLALFALTQIKDEVDKAVAEYGAHRVGVVVGTSTSGIAESENAFLARAKTGAFPDAYHYTAQELGTVAEVIAKALGTCGICHVHSSACSSGAKAIAAAARLIESGQCDAVVTGGVDTLSGFVIAGFDALEAVSSVPTNPFSANRSGINIGEGAALFLMSRKPAGIALAGFGESSDGYHISAPEPTGKGARLAIVQALERAGLKPDDIDYINLHGTGTHHNDAMEAHVIHELFGEKTPASSTKAMTGHTLGAAGAVEAGLAWLAMQDDNPEGILPPHLYDGQYDSRLAPVHLVTPGEKLGRPIGAVLSTSFAFGGSNAALVLRRMP